jgi:hypothetical protein
MTLRVFRAGRFPLCQLAPYKRWGTFILTHGLVTARLQPQRIAGGVTDAAVGFVGGFDNVVISSLRNVVDTYDFEPASTGVPEPASLTMAALAFGAFVLRRLARSHTSAK